jgi:iron complex transport system substrate-binding protein
LLGGGSITEYEKGNFMVEKIRNYLIPILILSAGWCCPVSSRQITDMAGRQVNVPEVIRKVYGTSPPATYMIYAIDPGLMAGLNFPLNQSGKQYLDPRVLQLPVIGGWFGQGRVPNLETLLQVRPDIVLVWMWQQLSAVNEKMEQTIKPLGIPIVYIIIDTPADYPKAFDFLGELFNRKARSRVLRRYAKTALAAADRMRAAIPDEERVTVYYAEDVHGLSTECHTSMHAQLIPLSGGKNVHRCVQRNRVGRQRISMETVLGYDPQVIISHETLFLKQIAHGPKWKNIRAVREGRVYKIPRTPFNWFDRPPSFMRLLGIHWMMHNLYPQTYPIDMVAETRHFYRLFLNVDLNEATAKKILQQ